MPWHRPNPATLGIDFRTSGRGVPRPTLTPGTCVPRCPCNLVSLTIRPPRPTRSWMLRLRSCSCRATMETPSSAISVPMTGSPTTSSTSGSMPTTGAPGTAQRLHGLHSPFMTRPPVTGGRATSSSVSSTFRIPRTPTPPIATASSPSRRSTSTRPSAPG